MSNVVSRDGTRLAVQERGNPGGPTVVCVHGFPDCSALWDGVVRELAADFRVITFDMRGAGSSDRPKPTRAYRLERLAEDLKAVGVKEDVHLIGHDWGSVAVWHALANGLRAASFTSISGPDLGRAREWLERHRFHRQSLRSSYLLFFQIPWAAELVSRIGLLRLIVDRLDPSHRGHPVSHQDVKHGLKLYRANVFAGHRAAGPIGIPVQVIAPTRDRFVGVPMQTVADGQVHEVAEGHWVPLTNPRFVADRARDFISGIMGCAS
jgi:pimeloyl-ACP methyl ester carboxylesterase